MSTTKKQELRTLNAYLIGMALGWSGFAIFVFGGICALNRRTMRIIVLDGGDAWITFLAIHRFDLVWAGLMLMFYGIPVFWRAQDNQNALERTNRLVDFTERRSHRRTGGV